MRPSDVTSLLDLPDEVLEKIVDQLDDESIIRLSLTCRKFHLLALPVVFARAKLPKDTTTIYLQQPPLHLLRALRIALFVHRATSFVISLNPDGRLPEILSLNRFISRMSTMTSSTFFFPLSSLPLSQSDKGGVFDDKRWTRGIIRLFDTVLDKPCVSFRVSGDMMSTHPTLTGAQPPHASPSRAPLLWRLFTEKIGHRLGISPKMSKRAILHILPQNLRPLGSRRPHRILQRFHALSPTLFQSPFLKWTTSTLQTSSHKLTVVSFKTDHVPTSTWHILLSKLTLPTLFTFRVTCDRIIEERMVRFNDMLDFLIRHPSIIDLDLYGLAAPKNSHRPRTLLPALQMLTSHPELIVWLLDCQYPPEQLKSLNMVSEVYPRPLAFGYNMFDDVLALLPRTAPLLTTLTMSFFSVPGVIEWINKHISPDHGPSSSPLVALEGITTLELILPQPWETEVTDVIPRFLTQFPALQHLTYPAPPPNLDTKTVQRMFLTEIALACPGITTVVRDVKKVDFDSLIKG